MKETIHFKVLTILTYTSCAIFKARMTLFNNGGLVIFTYVPKYIT